MKKTILAAFTIFLMSLGLASATIVGSDHDLSFLTGNNNSPPGDSDGSWLSANEDEVCIFCHTPHGGKATDYVGGTRIPLWNRPKAGGVDIGGSTQPTFNLYASSSLNATLSQPTGNTLLCLSCHDGISSLYEIINYARTYPITSGGANAFGEITVSGGDIAANIGEDTLKNLGNDHPVSFVYNDQLVFDDASDHGGVAALRAPTVANLGNLKLFERDAVGGGGRLECATCHDPHEEGSIAAGTFPYLRRDNIGSQLCLTCHIK